MTANPVVLRARLQQIQMDLLKIRDSLAGGGREEAMAWQAISCSSESLNWAIANIGRLCVDKLTKTEQAEEAASRA